MFMLTSDSKYGKILSVPELIIKKYILSKNNHIIYAVDFNLYKKLSAIYLIYSSFVTIFSAVILGFAPHNLSRLGAGVMIISCIIYLIHRFLNISRTHFPRSTIETIEIAPNFIVFECIGFWTNIMWAALFSLHFTSGTQKSLIILFTIISIISVLINILVFLFYRKTRSG